MMTGQSSIKYASIGRNSLFVTAGALLGAFIIFPINIAISRYLGAEGFGDFAFVFALLTVFQTFSDGGFQSIVIRDIARNKAKVLEIFSSTYVLIWLISIAVLVVWVAYFELFNPVFRIKATVYIMILTGLVTLHALMFVGVVRAHEAMDVVALAGLGYKLLILCLVLLAIKLDMGLQGIAIAHLLAALCYWLFFIIYVSRHYCRVKFLVNFAGWSGMIREALPLGIAITLRKFTIQLDIFMLSYLASSATVGFYSASYRVVQLFEIGALSLCSVIYPLLSKLSVESINKFSSVNENAFKVLVVMISPVIAWIILLTNDVVQLLYGNSFASAAKALTVLACAMLFTVPATLFYSTFAALGKQKTFMYITVFILMVKTILDRILIPSYAEIGTAYATIVTEFIMLFMCIVILHLSKITMEIFTIYGKAWMCVGFSMLIMMPFMMGSTLVIKVTASLLYYAIYLMMVFITGLFKIADVKILFKKI